VSTACPGLYSNMECSVRLNGNMTDWFNVDSGLKQGCILSSIMFNIYVNSLIDDTEGFLKCIILDLLTLTYRALFLHQK
jgi:hypothetical protein